MKIIKLILCFALIGAILGTGLAQSGFSINAKAAILMDPLSGKVLFAQNEHQHLPPASVTKVMTMLLIMEAIDSGRAKWSDTVRASRNASLMGGSGVYLKEGEEFSLRELFETIAVVSANDSSTAVAEYLYGSVDDFVAAMNDRAKSLGLKDTHFANETGLPDPDHYSSAYDLALLSRELITRHPEVLKFTSIWLDWFRGGKFQLRNTNELIQEYRGADGLKTGHTDEAGFCLAATAQKGDFRLLSIILGTSSDAERIKQSKRLLDYGYRNYQWKMVKQAGEQEVGRLYFPEGEPKWVPVKLHENLGVVVARGSDLLTRTVLVASPSLHFPIKTDQKVGVMKAMVGPTTLGEVPVYAKRDVHRANWLVRCWRWFWDWVWRLFRVKKSNH